ncbi:MAG: hypothetical protein JRN52_06970 [Nitrososphaerota archaeon]|nr:hypothetical protein [Nitrososphaerota archaeon]
MSPPEVAQQPEKTEDLSLEEISTKYAGRWVALTVTARDKNLQPIRGIVVADEVDRYRLRSHITNYQDICIIFAGGSPYHLML